MGFRRFPDAGLLPKDAETEAQARSCMSFAASTLYPARRQDLDHAKSVWAMAE